MFLFVWQKHGGHFLKKLPCKIRRAEACVLAQHFKKIIRRDELKLAALIEIAQESIEGLSAEVSAQSGEITRTLIINAAQIVAMIREGRAG